jgi:hypothetical protein
VFMVSVGLRAEISHSQVVIAASSEAGWGRIIVRLGLWTLGWAGFRPALRLGPAFAPRARGLGAASDSGCRPPEAGATSVQMAPGAAGPEARTLRLLVGVPAARLSSTFASAQVEGTCLSPCPSKLRKSRFV